MYGIYFMKRPPREGNFLVEGLVLVITIVLHETLLSRWLTPIASAFASSVLVNLAITPFYLRYRNMSMKRIVVFVVLTAVLICLIEVLSK